VAELSLRVNGREVTAEVEPRTTLADFLRDDLRLTGTHLGCEHGVCGACTVLLDGRTHLSCLLLAVQANGADVLTVEGLTEPDAPLDPVQQAFADNHGLQCGFCTPGFLLTVHELLREEPDPDEQRIRERISGNLCRCTGYETIVAAVADAARRMAAS
jgi:aerobic-type carbon monoxide dehydrogenase small subunit (CoxS/CutS family)